jgi:hypothetical protein
MYIMTYISYDHTLFSRRCLAFMTDEREDAFIAVRWYKEKTTFPVHAVLELPALEIASAKMVNSYSVLPVHCVVNGALLIKCGGTTWAVQSPREEVQFIRANQQ